MNIIYEASKNAKSAKKLQQEVGATALLLKNSADRKDNYHPLCLVLSNWLKISEPKSANNIQV